MKEEKSKPNVDQKISIIESLKKNAQDEYRKETGEKYEPLSASDSIKRNGYLKAMTGEIFGAFIVVATCFALTVTSAINLIVKLVQFLILEPVRMLFRRD